MRFIVILGLAQKGQQSIPVVSTSSHLDLVVECLVVYLEVLRLNSPEVNFTPRHNDPDYRVVVKAQSSHCAFQLFRVVLTSVDGAFH